MDIIKISITVAIIGIVMLFLTVRLSQQNTIKIADISLGQVERVSGMINSLYTSKDGHTFIKLADTSGEITVVAFKSANIDVYGLNMGDQVSVLGRVEEYKGEMEIVASEIRKV
jgi:DNA/RNA endonuclease YhcR with UshA esterase domain